MKTFISKLIVLADGLDRLGLKKDADKIDKLITMAARGKDYIPQTEFTSSKDERSAGELGELMSLFDEPSEEDEGRVKLEFDEPEEGAPFRRPVTQIPEEAEVLTEIEPLDEPAEKKKEPSRLELLKRRNELLKLKRSLEATEPAEEDEEEADVNVLPVASPEDFEDESDEENDADDSGLFDELKEKLKGVPELAKQVLMLIKDNPELLELLAL